MERIDEALVQAHLDANAELKNLWQEHLKLEQQLDKINRKLFLSPQEKAQKKKLQLEKLAGKTKIENIIAPFRPSA